MPVLARLQAEYADEGLRVLAINIQSNYYSLEAWKAFMEQYAPADMEELTASLVAQDVNNEAARRYELKALGTEILLDRQGRVALRSEGPMAEQKLRSEIEATLYRNPSAASLARSRS